MKTLILTTALILTSLLSHSQTINATKDQQNFWNGFVSFVAQKGYTKSAELDNRDKSVSKDLWSEYNRVQGTNYKYETFVIMVQTEITSYRNQALVRIHSGSALSDCKNDDEFMPGLSVIDGWAGSKTCSWRFPVEIHLNLIASH